MRQVITGLYALALTIGMLYLLWILQPTIVAHPMASAIIMFLLFSVIMMGATVILIPLLTPIILLCNKKNIAPVAAYWIFILGLLVSLVIPWWNGVSGFGFWEWAASIMYTILVSYVFYMMSNGVLNNNERKSSEV